jgi:hypothetical protein
VDGVWPDGLELYLAAEDLRSPTELDVIADRLLGCSVPNGFAFLIEGPVDSLDGADFDVTRDSEADRLVVRRLAELARRIGARAVNIHVIAPSEDLGRLTLDCRATLLERAAPLLREFVGLVEAAGAVPTIENMPPVLRMRRGGFSFTPIGMASQDLVWLAERIPGLAILPDTSHAGLYLNARRLSPDPEAPWSAPLLAYIRQLPDEARDLLGYLQSFAPYVANAQVSNATGLLGEGAPYAEGDFDLDPAIAWLGQTAEHIVTETLEPDSSHAVYMRDALRRVRAVLA